jgi:hypothetical protein
MSLSVRSERRIKQRIQLTRAIVVRIGAIGAVILDITDCGARIEHLTRLNVGRQLRLRFAWEGFTIEVDARVVACKVHRFAHGDDGATVYQSGLAFIHYEGNALGILRELVTTTVSRSLAEQVANARGIGPVTENHMPVFRGGVVTTSQVTASGTRQAEPTLHRGFVRCSLMHGRWDKKWSRSPDQPEEGFTVPATETNTTIDQLCDTYKSATQDQRELIRAMARLSVETETETPEPVS